VIVNRVTLLGQKDHGKSTVIGNLLISTGSVTEERIKEAKKISNEIGKPFEPAFIMDSFSEERERGLTIDTTRADIVYNGKIFEFIDVPGHLELLKNMMSGASSGDVAVAIISAKKGEGFTAQTRRHIFIASMFGMRALIIAVNKLDYIGYDEHKFEKICENVKYYLDAIGFGKPVTFVPISAYRSENIVAPSKRMPWYGGMPLMKTIDSFISKYGEASNGDGLRVLVQSVMEDGKKRVAFGMIYSGKLHVGDRITVHPEGFSTTVHKIYLKGKSAKNAAAGENIALEMGGIAKVSRGNVIYGANERPYALKKFDAKVFAIKHIKRSNRGKLHIKANNNDVKIRRISVVKAISPVTGDEQNGAEIGANSAGVVRLELQTGYPVEAFKKYAELGRFAIYENENFVGIGTVL
jgi:translation elongation factor EF-1alpha